MPDLSTQRDSLRGRVARCAIVGCGSVSQQYAQTLEELDVLQLVACHDADKARGEAFAARTGSAHIADLDELLAADHEVTVILTPPALHAGITGRAVRAGRSVYSEKPLAMEVGEAAGLLSQAVAAGVLIGCAPDTFLGPALQGARRLIDAGDIGQPLAASATMLQPGPERWHPNPECFHLAGIGPLVDMGPYYLTALVALLGPIVRVAGAHHSRVTSRTVRSGPRAGEQFTSEVPTHVAAVLELRGGMPATVTMSFDAQGTKTPHIEVHGTEASVVLPDPNFFDGPAWLRRRGATEWCEVHVVRQESAGRGIGMIDLMRSLLDGTPVRASGLLGLHVLEVVRGIEQASQTGRAVAIRHLCPRPAPMPGIEVRVGSHVVPRRDGGT